MYTSHGINMKRELEYYDKRTKRIIPNKSTPKFDIKSLYSDYDDSVKPNYKFSDMIESVKECINSDENNCTIKSCMLNREIPIDKKAITMGAIIVGVGIGVTIATVTTISVINKPRRKDYYSIDGWSKIIKSLI